MHNNVISRSLTILSLILYVNIISIMIHTFSSVHFISYTYKIEECQPLITKYWIADPENKWSITYNIVVYVNYVYEKECLYHCSYHNWWASQSLELTLRTLTSIIIRVTIWKHFFTNFLCETIQVNHCTWAPEGVFVWHIFIHL